MEFSFKCEFVLSLIAITMFYCIVVNYLLDLQNYAEGIYL